MKRRAPFNTNTDPDTNTNTNTDNNTDTYTDTNTGYCFVHFFCKFLVVFHHLKRDLMCYSSETRTRLSVKRRAPY